MPNHIHNILTFECNEEKMKEIRNFMKPEDAGNEEIFDFNKLIKMPPELNIVSGSETDRGIEVFLTFCNPETKNFGYPKLGKEDFETLYRKLCEERSFFGYRNMLSEGEIEEFKENGGSIEEILERGRAAVLNFVTYGATTWYEWCTENWDTKWNAYDSEEMPHGYVFNTAWSAPFKVISALSAKFPDIRITHKWADEAIGFNCGLEEHLGGEIISSYFPVDKSCAVKFSNDIWGNKVG